MDDLFFSFSNLAQFPELAQGVSFRQGPTGERLNLGGEFDAVETISVREKNLNRALDLSENVAWFKVRQTHGATVLSINTETPSNRVAEQEADALISARKNVVLSVRIADCQGILLYDPHRRVVAAVHSGWRGSAQNIVGRTIERLAHDFAVDPTHLWAGVSPSLGPCCARFSDPDKELPSSLLRHRVGTHHIDFWAATECQLTEAGVPFTQIELARECTCCHPERWFSHRGDRDHPERQGRMAAMIGLRP